MTEAQINEIQSLFYSGMKKAEIARKIGCPIGHINYFSCNPEDITKSKLRTIKERNVHEKKSFTKAFMIFCKSTKSYRFMRFASSFLIKRNCMIKIETVLYRIFCKENTKGIFRSMFFRRYAEWLGKRLKKHLS